MPPSAPAPYAAPTSNPAQLGGILLLVCAGLILIGTVTRGWFTMSRGNNSSSVGLIGYKFCYDGECKGKIFEPDMSKGADADVTAARYLAFLGGLGAVVVAGLGGAMALGRKPDKVPLLAIYIVCGIAAFFGLYFIGRALSEVRGSGGPGPGWSFCVAFIGHIGAAVIAGVMIRPHARRTAPGFHPGYPQQGYAPQPQGYAPQPQGSAPPQPGYAPPQAPQQQAAPSCPRCVAQGQVTYAAQYQRYFCGRCQQYV